MSRNETSQRRASNAGLSTRRSARIKILPSLLAATLATAQGALATELIDLEDGRIGNLSGLYIADIDASSNVMVGAFFRNGNHQAFRWDAVSGKLDELGTLGGDISYAKGVNATGDVVVGESTDNAYNRLAFRWTSAGGMSSLGTLGGDNSTAEAVNIAGDVVVGSSNITGNSEVHAFRWTLADGMQDLGTLGGGSSDATALNGAGDVVVGTAENGAIDMDGSLVYRAFRWTEASGQMQDLGTLGGSKSNAYGVNSQGDVVVGDADTGAVDINGKAIYHAFRWTEASGQMQDLSTLGGDNSNAYGVNKQGDVVVGQANAANGDVRAFRWTETGGMQSIEDWLAAHKVTVHGMNTQIAHGVNADGTVVIGLLGNGHPFLARVTPDGTGMIDIPAFNTGLYRVANSALLAVHDADLVMHGAHGNPMRSLLPVGRSSFWTAGDVGRQDHGVYDSKQGVAEVGYGYRPAIGMQFNIAVGRTYSSSDTGLGGNTRARSTYVFPELILSVPDRPLRATLSAYYGQGDLRIDRAYLNAGTLTHAYARPDTTTMSARVRLDWVDAMTMGKTSLTPYTSLSYLEARVDGYTEQGQGFPVRWNQHTEHATTAHIGVDAVHPLSDTLTVLARVEAAHRFESQGAVMSGALLGAGGAPLAFPGQDLKQNWLRVGLGLEQKTRHGIASLILNATTQGEMPAYLLAANYRWVF